MSKRGDRTRVMTRLTDQPADTVLRRKIQLEVISGVDSGRTVVGPAPVLDVGTQQGNTLLLHDDAVSRIHLEITSTSNGIRLRDLASTNGTWVGPGIRLTEGMVPTGSVVRVGKSQIKITILDEAIQESLSHLPGFGQLIGESPAMRAIFAILERVAPTDETVLITGETGTGKELCAHSIVSASRRARGPMVVVDCGAIPPNLLESELFGHVRGAFTGAMADYIGAFERANGGTVFLDEVGELPLPLQTRMLRAVEARNIRRVGDSKVIPLDIRIIAATNRRLEEEVNAGTFRADLYYRLSVVQVRIPPLRERPQDIEALARHLLLELNVDHRAVLTAQVIEQLKRYRWPGNVRELRNYLRRMSLGGPESSPGAPPSGELGAEAGEDGPIDLSQPFKDAKEAAINRFERLYLGALMDQTAGNVSQAARVAQTDRTYLSRLLAKHGIRR